MENNKDWLRNMPSLEPDYADIDKDRYIVEWFPFISWDEYPIGTKAHSYQGGYWIKKELGWKWHCGATFPTPGADAREIEIDLTTWEGFGWLWGKMRASMITWDNFMEWLHSDSLSSYVSLTCLIDNPDKFRDAVYEFLKSQEASCKQT